MDMTARFYCEVLGLSLKATHGAGSKPQNQLAPTGDYTRLYFFELGNGDGLGFVEFKDMDVEPEISFFDPFWPKTDRPSVKRPRKLDHLAFNLESHKDLVAMQDRLRQNGIEVSEVQSLTSSPFLKSIYCYDPNGLPIEFAAWDWSDPAWEERNDGDMFADLNPIPYLRKSQDGLGQG